MNVFNSLKRSIVLTNQNALLWRDTGPMLLNVSVSVLLLFCKPVTPTYTFVRSIVFDQSGLVSSSLMQHKCKLKLEAPHFSVSFAPKVKTSKHSTVSRRASGKKLVSFALDTALNLQNY